MSLLLLFDSAKQFEIPAQGIPNEPFSVFGDARINRKCGQTCGHCMTSSMRSAIVPKWKTKTNLINKGIFAIHAKKLVTVTLHKPIITLSTFQNATY